MHRVISGLRWAKFLADSPHGKSRPRGAKLAGLLYERALAKALPDWHYGQWIEFLDSNGRGFAQVDLFQVSSVISGPILVLEAKYTWTPEGHSQIERLYKPLLEHICKCKCLGIVVSKRLVPEMHGVAISGDLAGAIELAKLGYRSCLHWLGNNALGPHFGPHTTVHTPALAPRDLGL